MTAVTVTRDQLVERDACHDGLALFDRWFPDGTMHVPEWTWLHSLWLSLDETRLYAGWLRGADLVPACDLRGADLTGADLRGADLRGADLRGADLRGADRSAPDPAIPGWVVVDGRLVAL